MIVAQAVSESGGKVERTFRAVPLVRNAVNVGRSDAKRSINWQSRASMPISRTFIVPPARLQAQRAGQSQPEAMLPAPLFVPLRQTELPRGGWPAADTTAA